MENAENVWHNSPFNENEWIKLIFFLSDIQHWVNDLASDTMMLLPMKDRKKLFRRTFYLSATALSHIIERHYYKIPRHPGTSKFTVPLIEILAYLRDAAKSETISVPGSGNFQRTLSADKIIGIDSNQLPTNLVTVLTDSGGRIITAFPGPFNHKPHL